MSKTPEGKVKAAARKILDAYGVYTVPPVTGGFGVSGQFDEIACVNGQFLGIEYKADSKKEPTDLQIKNAGKCRDKGKGITILIHKDNLDLLEHTIKELLKYSPPDPKLNYWPYKPSEPLTGIKVRKRK